MTKKFLLILAFAFVSANAEVVNSVIAVVENEPITNYELAQVKKERRVSDAEALEILINSKVKTAEIKKRGIMVNSYEIDQRIAAIAAQNNMSVEALHAAAAKDGISKAKFREDVKKSLQEEKLYGAFENEIRKSVTPENVRQFYNQNLSLFTTFDSVTLTRFIAKSADRLNAVLKNPNARPSGVHVQKGTLKNSQMDEGLRYIITNVAQGEFSPVIPTANGYETFYVNSKSGVQTADFESVQEKAIEAYVLSKRQQMLKEFNERLRSNANVRIINR
ncbi:MULTISPECIES: peptidylprolyl isomerase [unclassified Campylobacter]|uniref:peptidylprolyl isomerase n=1 Tax=unclassified Campylobacter TaxID=2593542 RepID=UPI001B04F9FA|nr:MULTISPECIES: peptidylprolyl isomerase [unclassified Campylobacter]MBO7370170.1 peptidyl-prolyl cis-trans isomerase [Campylobacter sp.]MBO7475432.1 peptidyl-prolyl cis-trans isomerase [Campylobacter sp.]MDA3056013.1 peptidyl-prolyl cis-trans isomerase [Campylobacter sp. CN_NA1]MDA3065158.1 peptidyl-prolyl cis-trans isomerase [Campylobacter sp. CN_NE4]MDA3067983.1 peptidyl-prolyl cis-trans isomerase [Campylobacter sp. CN_NE3]